MIPQWIIEKKRDGLTLSRAEIEFFIGAFARGEIPDYQMSALAMAILLRGMTADETVDLTRAMWRSGATLKRSAFPGRKIDKHSTGGIGDKVSLVLAPLAAACGVTVPMMGGRGLGITGGTLDKLESIPGCRTDLTERRFLRVLRACGCAIMGQTDRLAPADKKLYALRDVTGTVPSMPLIVASILCKKLALGIDGLVMDIKCGRGAFMQTRADAEALARALIATGRRLGLRVRALITRMDQPLGCAAGNALEVTEAVEALQGRGPADLMTVTLELGVRMLGMAGIAANRARARALLEARLRSGAAFERFKTMIRLQGGNVRALECPQLLPTAAIQWPLNSLRGGYICAVDAGAVGKACLALGAGRTRAADTVDHAVGMARIRKIGEKVNRGEPLAVVHANSRAGLAQARKLLAGAFQIARNAPAQKSVIIEELG